MAINIKLKINTGRSGYSTEMYVETAPDVGSFIIWESKNRKYMGEVSKKVYNYCLAPTLEVEIMVPQFVEV
jgi:hypothetical protein